MYVYAKAVHNAYICLEYMIWTVLNQRLQYDHPILVDHRW